MVLESLRENYDLVIIDSASFAEGPDALLVSAIVDGVLLAHPGQRTPSEATQIDRLHNEGVPFLGVIELGFPS